MTWKSDYQPFLEPSESRISTENFGTNERCFIRKEHKCGKLFGASKACFIACPTDDSLETILELLSEKLMKVGIEPIIAVKERAYGQDIFCTKICGKIIESKFCLVILDDSVKAGKNIPNPNVYYEYGLMTALRKHIIPLQKEDLKLAFNIQSYDTIKYNNKNIGQEMDRAIKEAIRISESLKSPVNISGTNDKTILRRLEIEGFILKDQEWFLADIIEDTGFKGFGQHTKGLYLYLFKIDNKDDISTALEDLDIVLFRTENKYREVLADRERLVKRKEIISKESETTERKMIGTRPISPERQINDLERQIIDLDDKILLMGNFYLGFIINSMIDIEDFNEKAELIRSKYNDKYHIIINDHNEINIDGIKINLTIQNF